MRHCSILMIVVDYEEVMLEATDHRMSASLRGLLERREVERRSPVLLIIEMMMYVHNSATDNLSPHNNC